MCLRGVTIAGVYSYGKGRVGVGLVSAVWVTGTELAQSAVAGHRLQLRHATPFFYIKGYDGATGVALGDSSGRCIGTLFFHSFVAFEGFWEIVNSDCGIGSCSGRALSVRGE